MAEDSIKALVWSEGTEPKDVYPDGIRVVIADALNSAGIETKTRSIEEDQQGASEAVLNWADVVLWWGHLQHEDVTDETVDRIEKAVREDGVGFISLHSSHYARPFKRLVDASGDLGEYRFDDDESEFVEVVAPNHPIAEGIEDFTIPEAEMFGDPFDIPEPQTVVLRSTYSNGPEEMRSGITFRFDEGRGFYLRPGHEEFDIYYDDTIQRILINATQWAAQ